MPMLIENLTVALNNPLSVSWTDKSLVALLFATGIYVLCIGLYFTDQARRRDGEEHGSAIWGSAKQVNAMFAQKLNKPLTRHVKLGLDAYKHKRNLNVLVIGGSGAAKTRGFVKPNILEGNGCSMVITDPKMEVLNATGSYLKSQGYDIRVLNLVNLAQSDGYNPFVYLRDDKDVLKLVTNLIQATTLKGSHESDPFWTKAETALFMAIILMLFHEAPAYEQNFSMVLKVLEYAEVKEEDEDHVSPLDLLFNSLEQEQPDHIAVKQYHIFKMAAGKTAKSILVSAGVRLAAFNLSQIAGLTCIDEMDLADLGEKKVALFCCIPDSDPSLNYLVGLLYTQAFQTLYQLADRKYGGRLPVHVHAVMDEWANISLPDDFEKLLSTMRSREISVSIIVQNIAQIKALYKDAWESIIGNCDSLLYLGGNEASTHEYLSKALGKETLATNTYGQSKGRSGSYSTNWQQAGRELLQPDEIRKLDNRYAILLLRGEAPMLDEKYDLMSHPGIRLTPDCGAPVYDHTLAPRAKDDVILDPNRADDYAILDADDILYSNYKNEGE